MARKETPAVATLPPFPPRPFLPAGTAQDAATLSHILQQGERRNTQLARAKDLKHFYAWRQAVAPQRLPSDPVTREDLCLFIAHHLYDAQEKKRNPQHGLPPEIAEKLRDQGTIPPEKCTHPYCASTVRRMLTSIGWYCRQQGWDTPHQDPAVRLVLRAACANADAPARKSPLAITREIVQAMIATCGDQRLIDLRDRALLAFLYASGGRRRSEAEQIQVEDLVIVGHDDGQTLLDITLGRTKRTDRASGHTVTMVGRAADYILSWMQHGDIHHGPVFRCFRQGKGGIWQVGDRGLGEKQVSRIVKQRLALAGYVPKLYSAHGLRSGYLTDGVQAGIQPAELMQQAALKTPAMLTRYYNDRNRRRSRAARLGADL